MIGWSVIGATLQGVFSEIAINRGTSGADLYTGDAFGAEWVDGKKAWQDGRRFIITDPRGFALGLTVTAVTALGHDETRQTDADDGNILETQSGQRKFTLQVQALTIAGGVNSDWAVAITERARTRLISRRISERLLDIDVDVIECGPSVFLSHRDGSRMVTSATMDVVFGCTASEDDPVTAGWIQYLVISSHLRDIDGTELGASQQMVNVEVPTIP